MNKKPPHNNPFDDLLWKAFVKDVKPLPKNEKVEVPCAPKFLIKRKSEPTLPLYVAEKEWVKGEKHAQPKKKDKHSRVRVDDKIDLHGLTLEQAYDRLCEFLHQTLLKNARTVLIVTGKSGLLHNKVPRWLEVMSDTVKSFEYAPEAQGGKGALCVFLKSVQD